MPLAPGSQHEFTELYTEASKCVVSISRSRELLDKKTDLLNENVKPAGTGFVVHVTDKVSVVACHTSCASKDSKVSVLFPDGIEATRNDVVVLGGGMNLIFCDVERGEWKNADYNQLKEEPQDDSEPEAVLTVVSSYKLGHAMFTGQIISPRCSGWDRSGVAIPQNDELFTFRLGVGGTIDRNEIQLAKLGWKYPTGFVPGAPVFSMDKMVVGFVHECSYASDMKYGMRIESFVDRLNTWLGGRTWEAAIGDTFETTDELFDWYN